MSSISQYGIDIAICYGYFKMISISQYVSDMILLSISQYGIDISIRYGYLNMLSIT